MKALTQHFRGFTTLDALAGVMVLNMLCLGVLAMQMQALQAQRDALAMQAAVGLAQDLSLIHISEPTRRTPISYAVFCLK